MLSAMTAGQQGDSEFDGLRGHAVLVAVERCIVMTKAEEEKMSPS